MNLEKRPVLNAQPEKTDKILDITSFIFLLLILVLTLIFYPDLPERIPQHFSFFGEVDKLGPKPMFFILPGLSLFLYLLLTYLSRIPHKFNYLVKITEENAVFYYKNYSRMLRVLKTYITMNMAYIIYAVIEISFGRIENINGFFVLIFVAGVLSISLFFITKRIEQ